MRRILSIWLPEFSLERLRRAEPSAVPRVAPFALAMAEGNRLIVSAANQAALAAGVRPGMGLADARAIAPMLASRPAEPARDAAALARLARWLMRYGPAFNTDGPDGLWVDATGVAHLYGGEAGLKADIARRLSRFGLTAELGLGDGLGAAWAFARFQHAKASLPALGDSRSGGRPPSSSKANGTGEERLLNLGRQQPLAAGSSQGSRQRQAKALALPEREWEAASKKPASKKALLSGLPVEALRIEADAAQLLRRLGLKRIGQLYALPRAAIERRFRSRLDPVLTRLDQALGVKPEPLRPMRVPPTHAVRAAFAEPLISSEGLEAALVELVRELCASLSAAHRGARRLALTLHRSDGTRVAVRAGLSRPSRSGAHMLGLFREKLSAIDAGFGIDLMQLDALATGPLVPAQGGLAGGDETGEADDEALAALIDRLAGRLGAAQVLRLVPRASHLPERKESLLAASLSPSGNREESLLAASHSRSGSRPEAAAAFRRLKSPFLPAPLALPAPGGRLLGGESPAASKDSPPLLLPTPELITVVAAVPEGPPELMRWRRTLRRIVRAEGPRRIAPEWWREIGAAGSRTRDYYVVEDDTGARFWLFRDGRYGQSGDAGQPPAWYLHGVFA